MVGRVLDDVLTDLALTSAEHQVVAREIGVAQHVGRHEDVFREPVARGQVGVAGIAGKHHLEEARVAHVPLDELVDVPDSERPVRHAHRQPVHGDLHHEGVGDRFELNRVE